MSSNANVSLAIALSPSGHLYLDNTSDEQLSQEDAQKIEESFQKDYYTGLLFLGLDSFKDALPPSFAFWRRFSQRFITALCHTSEAASNIPHNCTL